MFLLGAFSGCSRLFSEVYSDFISERETVGATNELRSFELDHSPCTVDGSELRNNHLGYIKPCKS